METQTGTTGADAGPLGLGVHSRQDAAALAESVTFGTSREEAAKMSASMRAEQAVADRAQIDDWTDEGGRGR